MERMETHRSETSIGMHALAGASRAALPARPAPEPERPVALLVDDDGSARRQLASELGRRGFSVEASDDVEAATRGALLRRPALVVLELRLRSGSGLDLLARLRPELPHTRFVVVTHYGSVASAVRAMRLGATNYLCKPAAAAEVLRAAEPAASNDVGLAEDRPPGSALTLDEAIWEYINRTVEDAGSLSEAARRLGLWRQSLKRMISKYRPAAPRPEPAR
jgi:two-component system response regulator RegA